MTNSFLDHDKSLACIHCGLCLSSCPTYLETGNENDSPRGRIYLMRAVAEGRLPLGDTPVGHVDLCLGCRACEAACPSGVQYGELLEATREHIERKHKRSLWQTFLRRFAIEQVFPYPKRMELAVRAALAVKKLRLTALLPRFLREALSLLPAALDNVPLPERSPASPAASARGRVGFVSGCVMSVLFGETNAASVRLLNRAGYEVVTPGDQVCCGALFAHGGRLDQARACARRNIEVFDRLQVDAIVINAAGCGSTLKEYGHLLRNDPEWADRAAAFSRRVQDLAEWLTRPESNAASTSSAAAAGAKADRSCVAGGKVTYHDACHLAHAQRITRAPRELVRAVAGRPFVEMAESDVCCGSAGSYNLTEPAMAERLQKRKVEHILATGATTVVTTNPGCLLQIRAGLAKAGAHHVEAIHLADYLDRGRMPA